ncbi:MAG: phenylalanine--tRNA ligase subunit alpha [Nitrososphaera sp.]
MSDFSNDHTSKSLSISDLHPIEKDILRHLASAEMASAESLAASTGRVIDQIRRGIEWLRLKNLVSVSEVVQSELVLGELGAIASEKGLPERRLVYAVKAGARTIGEAIARGFLEKEEANAAVAAAKRSGWVKFDQGTLVCVDTAVAELSAEERAIETLRNRSPLNEAQLSEQEKKGVDLLRVRPKYIVLVERKNAQITLTETGRQAASQVSLSKGGSDEHQVRKLTPELIATGKWKEVSVSPIDVEAPAPEAYPGRVHPLTLIIDEIKEIFVGLGFAEIDGDFVQSAFWNFDALYTPQDHPAREMQDTFYLSLPGRSIPASADQISKISKVHEKGWGPRWSREEAERLVLRTHTTPVTLQTLAQAKPESARYFSVGRVFRNEKVSYKHLAEFHQVEGVATYEGATLRDLVGLQTEFYKKMGISKIKFWPTFFPYTEPSLQSMVYNDSLGKWVELFGMGIFRPEVTRPLGIKNPVLAWGGGLERIAMLRFGLNDVRDLYSSRLSWLRHVPECQL